MKRSKVRRNYLTYMRARSGKSTRLAGIDFDKKAVNDVTDPEAEAELERIKEEQKKNTRQKLKKKQIKMQRLKLKLLR